MIDPTRRKELIRRVGLGRITRARDLEDTWGRRLAAIAKPAAVLHALLISSVSIAVAGAATACVVFAGGYSLVSRDSLQLGRLVADLVPDAATLSAADLRVRFRSAARAVTLVDQTITARPVDPASLAWFERVFGTPAPQVDPGREAALLGIVDRLATLPIDQRADAADDMMQWALLGQNRHVWRVMKHIGEQPSEVRQVLLGSEAKGLIGVLAWLRERQGRGPEITNLTKAIEMHRRELADEIARMNQQNQSLLRETEGLRGRRIACGKQAAEFTACLKQRPL
ncbi:MAG: hypothetical protein ABS59_11450 [Methylobacterium sp. SCN 67-24]|jgi:hypothetical protein|nr:MAG: hypothetical protein ABS59_11450 [Methylobacterium sp. SCN 67-24]